ncbi:Anoctamin-7 [Plecturocebus cupreus]
MCLVSVILYRTIMAILVSRSGNTVLAAWASRIASLTGSVVNLIFILILSKIYVTLAHVLTRWGEWAGAGQVLTGPPASPKPT